MLAEIKRHKLAYLFLVTGLLLAVILFLGTWPSRVMQRGVILGLVIFYMVWGIVTHVQADHITRKIVYEYIGLGILGGLVLLLITL